MNLSYREAIHEALQFELNIDKNVVLFGEDIQKNLYGYTDGLEEKFGRERIINIPLSEASVAGMVCGAAMCGLRPVLDLTVSNFLYVAMDQIANNIAKGHYMCNGAIDMPLTIFCSNMHGGGNAAQHSDRPHSLFSTIPGLKIICPATPQDAYSMLRGAIEDNNPVLCFFDRSLFSNKQDINLSQLEPMEKARIVQKGSQLTIVTISSCLQMVSDLMPQIKEQGFYPEVIDLRSIVPMDMDTIYRSVERTGYVLICDTANHTSSTASEISARLAQNAFYSLRGPVEIVTCEDIPFPFARHLEQEVLVTKEKILAKIMEIKRRL